MKDWYKSKTLWFNLVYLIIVVFEVVARAVGYDQFIAGDDLVVIGSGLAAIVNLLLRKFFTDRAIA